MSWKDKEPETDKVKVTVKDESPKAYLMADNEHPEREAAWFPKSEVSFDRRNIHTGDALAVIPLWLLKSKGWNE